MASSGKIHITQPDLIAKLMKSFYVDDIVAKACDEDQAYALYETSRKVMMEGGFNLRKFCTNATLRNKTQKKHH